MDFDYKTISCCNDLWFNEKKCETFVFRVASFKTFFLLSTKWMVEKNSFSEVKFVYGMNWKKVHSSTQSQERRKRERERKRHTHQPKMCECQWINFKMEMIYSSQLTVIPITIHQRCKQNCWVLCVNWQHESLVAYFLPRTIIIIVVWLVQRSDKFFFSITFWIGPFEIHDLWSSISRNWMEKKPLVLL